MVATGASIVCLCKVLFMPITKWSAIGCEKKPPGPPLLKAGESQSQSQALSPLPVPCHGRQAKKRGPGNAGIEVGDFLRDFQRLALCLSRYSLILTGWPFSSGDTHQTGNLLCQ